MMTLSIHAQFYSTVYSCSRVRLKSSLRPSSHTLMPSRHTLTLFLPIALVIFLPHMLSSVTDDFFFFLFW